MNDEPVIPVGPTEKSLVIIVGAIILGVLLTWTGFLFFRIGVVQDQVRETSITRAKLFCALANEGRAADLEQARILVQASNAGLDPNISEEQLERRNATIELYLSEVEKVTFPIDCRKIVSDPESLLEEF